MTTGYTDITEKKTRKEIVSRYSPLLFKESLPRHLAGGGPHRRQPKENCPYLYY